MKVEDDQVHLAPADFSQIPMSQNLAATLARASDAANAIGSPEVGLEHVLLALCHDPDAEAVLMASRVDVGRLQAETAQYLGAQPNQPANGALGVAPALTRILEAAAAAARGSRRRDINGAIVLAAIVGDGKSVAAQILQAYGLTFDEAIRALQAALAPPPRDAIPDMRPADDVLARARERVQSRSAPSLRDIMSDAPRPALPPPAPSSVAADGPHLPPQDYDVSHEAASAAPVAPPEAAAAEPVPLPEPLAPAPMPETANPVPSAGYSYPTGQPMPPPAPVPMRGPPPHPESERSISLDLSRPAPIAMPPPIPPPFPQHGAPQGFPPAHPPAYPQHGGYAPMGAPPMQQAPQYGGNPYGQMAPPPAPSMQMPAPGARTGAPPDAARPDPIRKQRAKAEPGQLAENIPRGMRVGVTERVEIRIAKASVKALTEGLDGGGVAWRHEVTVTQAMSVRLRAPDGGFFIETVSPETQWIENQLGFASDDFASWRFLITPQTRGWANLQIVVSARTIGADGMAAETALPDQVVEVKVRTNYKRTFMRWSGWVLAAIAGGALAKFGEGGLSLAVSVITKFFK